MEKSKKLVEAIDKMARDLARIHAGGASDAHWPFSINYLSSFCTEEVLEVISCISDEKIKPKKQYPSGIAQLFYFLMGSRNFLTPVQRTKAANHLLESISSFRENLEDSRIKNFKINLPEEKGGNWRKVIFLLDYYLEMIAPTIMPLYREIHGPYIVGGKKVIVREYHDLRKLSHFKRIPENILIYELYENNTPEVDFFGHYISDKRIMPKEIFVFEKGILLVSEKLEEIEKLLREEMGFFSTKDKKVFIKNFVWSINFSLQEIFGHSISVQKIKEIEKRINTSNLIEKKFNPYEGLSEREIRNKLRDSLIRTFLER